MACKDNISDRPCPDCPGGTRQAGRQPSAAATGATGPELQTAGLFSGLDEMSFLDAINLIASIMAIIAGIILIQKNT